MEIRDWYRVRCTADGIALEVAPPGRHPWNAKLAWLDVIRVCYKPETLVSDGWYIFTTQRPESYVIPVDADGAEELLEQLLERGLFSSNLLIDACQAGEGLLCWPPS